MTVAAYWLIVAIAIGMLCGWLLFKPRRLGSLPPLTRLGPETANGRVTVTVPVHGGEHTILDVSVWYMIWMSLLRQDEVGEVIYTFDKAGIRVFVDGKEIPRPPDYDD